MKEHTDEPICRAAMETRYREQTADTAVEEGESG